MRHFVLGIILCMLTTPLMAEKTEDMFVMRHSPEGNLFFIRPNTFYSTNNETELNFDITHLNTTDAASIKMTVYEKTLVNVDSVAILCETKRYVCNNVASIYKEKENKLWIHRCDCVFPFSAVKHAMIGEKAPIIVIYTNKSTLSYTLTTPKWAKLCPHMRDIFMIIDSTKR
jgi:hypothetical protein